VEVTLPEQHEKEARFHVRASTNPYSPFVLVRVVIPSLPIENGASASSAEMQRALTDKASLVVRYSTAETHMWVWLRVALAEAAGSVRAFAAAGLGMHESWSLTVVNLADDEAPIPGAQVSESADVPLVRAGEPCALGLWAYRPLDASSRPLELAGRQNHT